jgi:hypothetical protein
MQRIPALRDVVLKVGNKYLLAFDGPLSEPDRVEIQQCKIKEIVYVHNRPAQVLYEVTRYKTYIDEPIEIKVFWKLHFKSYDPEPDLITGTLPIHEFMEALCEPVDEITVQI